MRPSLKLRNLDAAFTFASDASGTHSPHILTAIEHLNSLWSGEFDTEDTIEVLRHEARRLTLLAYTIEQNTKEEQDDDHDNHQIE